MVGPNVPRDAIAPLATSDRFGLPGRLWSALVEKARTRPIAGRFARLLGWSVAAFALDKLATLCVIVILAHILAPSDYGRFVLSQGFVASAQIAVVLGFGPMLARYIPAFRAEGANRTAELVSLCAVSVLVTFCLVGLAGLIGARFIATSVLALGWPSVVPFLLIAWVGFTAASNLLSTVLLANENGSDTAWASLVVAPIQMLTVPLAASNWGIEGAVAVFAGTEALRFALLGALYARAMSRSGASAWTPPRTSDWPLLWRFGLPVFLISAFWMPTIWVSQLVLKSLHPAGLAEVAQFGLALNVMGAIMILSSLIDRVSLPMSATIQRELGHQGLQHFSIRLSLLQGTLTIVIAALTSGAMLVLADFYESKVSPSGFVLIIMAVNSALLASQTAPVNLLLVENRVKSIMMTMIPWCAVTILGTALFYQLGAVALASSMAIANAIRLALVYLLAYGLDRGSTR